MSYLIGAAVIGVTTFFSVLWLVRQWRLAREGITIRARVYKKLQPFGNIKGPLSGMIQYDFLTPRGEFVKQSVFIGEAVAHLHEEGSEIEVVYLKDNPEVSGTKDRVNMSRELMNMPPL